MRSDSINPKVFRDGGRLGPRLWIGMYHMSDGGCVLFLICPLGIYLQGVSSAASNTKLAESIRPISLCCSVISPGETAKDESFSDYLTGLKASEVFPCSCTPVTLATK